MNLLEQERLFVLWPQTRCVSKANTLVDGYVLLELRNTREDAAGGANLRERRYALREVRWVRTPHNAKKVIQRLTSEKEKQPW